MWVRGLKRPMWQTPQPCCTSHPMWVRGLKQVGLYMRLERTVAPYVGAWIETHVEAISSRTALSHPMWVRGLKLMGNAQSPARELDVAPYVGAWIETNQWHANIP